MRKQMGFMALLGVLGAFVVSAPVAGADLVGESPTSGEVSPDAMSDCLQGYMCVWSGPEFSGQLSAWPGPNTGCHNHANNPSILSAWNRTGYTVRMGGRGNLASGESSYYAPAVYGEICWP